MKFPAFRTYVTSLLTAGSLTVAAVSLTGCGVFGHSWDVKMEVTGPGSADIVYSFSGDSKGKTASDQKLPWAKARSVRFGFNELSVNNPKPGTTCRIYVDDKLKDQQKKPNAKGYLSCYVLSCSKTHRCRSMACRSLAARLGACRDVRSLLYKVTRQLLAVPAVLLRRETSKEAELLVPRHENAVLRRQLQGRVRYEPADRLWLAALSSLIPRTPAT